MSISQAIQFSASKCPLTVVDLLVIKVSCKTSFNS